VAQFEITKKTIVISPTAGQNKVYGVTDPTFAYTNSPALETVDNFTGALGRDLGTAVALYNYTLGDLSAGGNYTLALSTVLPVALFEITPKTLNITANNLSKCFNTTLTFAGTEFMPTGLVSGTGDAVTSVTLASMGATMAAPVSTYDIVPTMAAGTGLGNYTITYTNGTLTVNALPIAGITGAATICSGITTTLTASGGNEYKWEAATMFSATATYTTPVLTATSTIFTVIAKNTTTGCSSLPATFAVATVDCSPAVAVTVLLESAYIPATGLMRDGLRTNGKIPPTQPYNTFAFTGVNGAAPIYTGNETVAPSVLAVTGSAAIVDWILLEIRDNVPGNAAIVARRAALLRADGKVVDLDGFSPVRFTDLTSPGNYLLNGNYHIAVRHRLCLGTRTRNAVPIVPSTATGTPAVTSFDFTLDDNLSIVGGVKTINNTTVTPNTIRRVLFAGDVNRDGNISSFDISAVRSKNPTLPATFDYLNFGYDFDFNASVFASDVAVTRVNNGVAIQANLKQ
jgi:hypothetical protein